MKKERGDKGAISSSIPALDESLHKGGFRKGSIILIVGDPGSRKDLFGYHFLLEGLQKGEKVAFYDVESSSDEVLELMEDNVTEEMLQGLEFMDVCPEYSKFFINAAPAKILESMRTLDPISTNRVLINPLTFFIEKFGLRDTGDLIIMIRDIAMKKGLVVMFLMADILLEKEMESVIDKFDGILELDTVRIIEGIYHTIQVRKFSVQQKNVQLTYNIDETRIMVTSTGKII
ncbi:MAG: RAD55 family ATPase [Candidatus Thermoplasmatota archaeon]|nr:RAD55 family ATPase [Candidatus Thermoplasmatota archaeon]